MPKEDALTGWQRVLGDIGQADVAPSTSTNGWLEAAVAWEVCASIHSTYAKGKDALFTTQHGDFVKHAEDARKKAVGGLHAAERERFEAWAKREHPCWRLTKNRRSGGYQYTPTSPAWKAWQARAALSAPAVPLGLTIERSFRWDGDARRHIPTLLIEFEAVPAGEPNDAKGWADRDSMAHWLHAAAPSAKEPQS